MNSEIRETHFVIVEQNFIVGINCKPEIKEKDNSVWYGLQYTYIYISAYGSTKVEIYEGIYIKNLRIQFQSLYVTDFSFAELR